MSDNKYIRLIESE